MPVILLTLHTDTSHDNEMLNLRVLLRDSCQRCDLWPWPNNFLALLRLLSCTLGGCTRTTLDKCEDVSLCHSTILSSTWNLIDIDSLRLGDVPNSWSRQGFSTSTDLITWRCSCNLVFYLILNWNLIRSKRLRCLQGSGWLSCFNIFRAFAFFFDLDDNVTHCNNIIVTVIYRCDLSSCCRWNLGDKLISEYFAQVLILYNDFIGSKFKIMIIQSIIHILLFQF